MIDSILCRKENLDGTKSFSSGAIIAALLLMGVGFAIGVFVV